MKSIFKNPYCVMLVVVFMMINMALLNSSYPFEIIEGLIRIYVSPDILITDYIELSGLAAAFANSAIMGLICIVLLMITKHEPTGKTIMSLWLVCGFSFFGKNFVNSVPIILGGIIYSRYMKEPIKNNLVYTFLGTGLAPAVTQVYNFGYISKGLGIMIGVLFGIMIGFVIIPLTISTTKLHTGHNLYNSGFSAGLLAMLIMALFRGIGIDFSSNNLWSQGNNDKIFFFIMAISTFLILIGVITGDDYKERIKNIFHDFSKVKHHGKHFYDDVKDYSYINMGILGICACILMLVLKVELSGPVLGGIFTIIGFGCCGKNIQNIVPVMAGALLAGALSVYGLGTPSVIIAILFSSCLAPIVSDYGVGWGFIAGILHVNFVMNSGDFHGGMNLYNNGLAGGFVAIILVPLIEALNTGRLKRKSKS